MKMKEKQIISKFFVPLTGRNKNSFNLKNDGALINNCKDDEEYIITTDTVIENVHFFSNDCPEKIAQKALRVNISDLAAMGALPSDYLINLTLSKSVTEEWLYLFTKGLKKDMKKYKIKLIGGDSTFHKGPAVISITATGIIKKGKILKKTEAKENDLICISGEIGNSYLGLLLLNKKIPKNTISEKSENYLIERYHIPSPKIALGNILCGLASSATDISDGLISDLEEICNYSNSGANISIPEINFSKAAKEIFNKIPSLRNKCLSGGDDYELIFTISKNKYDKLIKKLKDKKIKISVIGKIKKEKGIKIFDENKNLYYPEKKGFEYII